MHMQTSATSRARRRASSKGSRTMDLRLPLLCWFSSAQVVDSVEWSVWPNVDAVPAFEKLGPATSVEDCAEMCEQLNNCTAFTWNHSVSPYDCHVSVNKSWDPTPNSHCTSGCKRGESYCPDPTPPVTLPHWTATDPKPTKPHSGRMCAYE